MNVPEFLKMQGEPWPVQTPILQLGEMERRHVNAVTAVSPADVGNAIDNNNNNNNERSLIRI